MTDRHPIDDPELDAVPADAEDEEEAGLYEHFAVTADKGQTPMRPVSYTHLTLPTILRV